jgi:hypothetical protein
MVGLAQFATVRQPAVLSDEGYDQRMPVDVFWLEERERQKPERYSHA